MVHALGKWHIRLGGDRYEATVTENDVREGRQIRLEHRKVPSEIGNFHDAGAPANPPFEGQRGYFEDPVCCAYPIGKALLSVGRRLPKRIYA